MKTILLFLVLAASPSARAEAPNPALLDLPRAPVGPAPAEPNLQSYVAWAEPLLHDGPVEATSAFTGKVFEWYEEERNRGLPAEVARDPQRIYVNVQRPLQQTIELEESGEIEEGNTIGAEVYAEMQGTPKEALDAMLFRWGKPIGAAEGKTYPPGGNFARRVDYFAPYAAWGDGAYATLTVRRDGGLLRDLCDRYLLLVRGDEERGYDVWMQFTKPGKPTETKQVFAIAIIRKIGDGKVSYKLSTRFQGQSYKVLGNVSIGRARIGFNVANVRAVQLEYMQMLQELRATGNIKDQKKDIEF